MARPLPDDLEKQIAGTARRSEIRSVAVFSFVFGAICGAGAVLGLTTHHVSGKWAFAIAAIGLAAVWFFASRKR